MKKEVADLKKMTVKELEKEALILRETIAKFRLEEKVNPPKDSNLLTKKRKRLARVLTVLTELREKEQVEK